jgi:hypothetical protein
MPLLVLTWNCCGGNMSKLDKFVTLKKPDVICLQEAPSEITISELYTNQVGPTKAYEAAESLEFESVQLKGGVLALSGVKTTAILVKRSVLSINSFNLLNYQTDENSTMPDNVYKATDQGFATRPPVIADLTIVGTTKKITVFNWHAPQPKDPYHTAAMGLFNKSKTLADAVKNSALTLIVGDLNQTGFKPYFDGFEGIQQKYDKIIGRTPTASSKVTQVELTKQQQEDLSTWSGDHFVLLGQIS